MPVRKRAAKPTQAKPKSGLRVKTYSGGSVEEMRSDAKNSGTAGDIWGVPKEGTVTVRFLTEPTDWLGYYEWYDSENKGYVPQADGDVIPKDSRSSFRYLANVLWQLEGSRQGKVTAFKMPKTVGVSLMNKFDKYGTIVDRDYEITRYGEGLNAEYDVTPEEKKRVATKGLELFDLEDVLVNERERVLGTAVAADEDVDEEDDEDETDDDADEDEEEEDEAPAPRASKKGGVARGGRAKKPAKPSLEEMGEAADGGSEDDAEALTAIGEAVEVDVNEYETWAEAAEAISDGLIEAEVDTDDYDSWAELLDAFEGEEDEDESEDEDDEESDDDEDEEEDEDDDDEAEEVEVDEESLGKMSVKELRELADEFDIDHSTLKSKAALIAAILEDSEE